MKLKHKLIPLASIGAVCATVTPLVTSCGTGWVDVTDKFIPTIAQYPKEGESMDYKGVNDAYLRALNNKEIFRQDYLWSMSNLISSIEGGGADIFVPGKDVLTRSLVEDANAYVAEVKSVNPDKGSAIAEALVEKGESTKKIKFRYDKVKLTVTDIKTGLNPSTEWGFKEYGDIPLVSFNMEYSYDYTRTVDSSSFVGTERQIMKGKSEYTNIPFIPRYNWSTQLFEFIAACPAADAVDYSNTPESFMTNRGFYNQNKDSNGNLWNVNVDYSMEYQRKGTMPIVGKINVTQKASDNYSFGAKEFWDVVGEDEPTPIQLEKIIYNFRRTCQALNEDGWMASYYLYPVGYNGKY